MSEPSLDKIDDYKTLSGEKRKVVFAVILSGLVMGIIYTIAYNMYDKPEDAIEVEKPLKYIPMK